MREASISAAGGRRIYLLVSDDESKPALVILHGWCQDSRLYRNLADELSKDYFVLVPDLPGFGRTEQMPGTPLTSLSSCIDTVLKEFRLEKAFLVGHSLGGMVAINFAKSTPDMVSGMLLYGSCGEPPKRSVTGWFWVGLRNFYQNVSSGGLKGLLDSLRVASHALLHPNWSWKTFWLATQGQIGAPRLNVPIIVAYGDKDVYFDEKGQINLAARLQGRLVEKKGWGHDWIFLFPKEAAELIRSQLGN